MHLHELATEARGFLERGTREAPGIGKILVSKGPPQWVENLLMAAHDDGSILPDDWRYEWVGAALDVIVEAGPEDSRGYDDCSQSLDEWADGAFVYTSEQTAWLASSNHKPWIVDEACKECDMAASAETWQRLVCGMAHEAREVFGAIWASLVAEQEARAEATP